MSAKLRIQICSDIDYDKLIAEIYYDEQFVALINQEKGIDHLMIEFPDAHNRRKSVELDWFLDAVQRAKKELVDPDFRPAGIPGTRT